MRIYLDSSALLKRVIAEPESDEFVEAIDEYHRQRYAMVTSSLSWIEVTRALRTLTDDGLLEVIDDVDDALSGVLEMHFQPEVVALARRVQPNILRSLDAIHLACALLMDADVVVTYDDRLAEACNRNGLRVARPGVVSGQAAGGSP